MSITFFASGSNEVNAIIHEDDRVFYLAPCDQTGGDCHVLAEESSDMFNVEDVESKPTMRELELMVLGVMVYFIALSGPSLLERFFHRLKKLWKDILT